MGRAWSIRQHEYVFLSFLENRFKNQLEESFLTALKTFIFLGPARHKHEGLDLQTRYTVYLKVAFQLYSFHCKTTADAEYYNVKIETCG